MPYILPSIVVAFLSLIWLRVPCLAADSHAFKPITKDGRTYRVRVTVGMHETAGWEHALTARDPSLRHWTWMPMCSFDQAFIGANNKHSLPSRPNHVYVKPHHIPLPQVSHDAPVAPERKYVLPNKVPLPVVERPVAPMPFPASQAADQAQSVTKVSAEIKAGHCEKPLAAKSLPIKVKTYGAQGDVYGLLKHPLVDDSLAEAHVHGKLITPKELY